MTVHTMPSLASGLPGAPYTAYRRTLKVGYVRLLDAAPFIVAKERGLFRDLSIRVNLLREVGWATIRNKISYGELDAAQALGPLPFVMTLGLSTPRIPCLALMVMNRGGNAITLSEDLWKREVRDAKSLAREIKGTRSIRRYVFGVVSRHSSHDIILRRWLKSAGILPDKEVQIVVLPPEQMVRCLDSGNIDGYCVGEPWNSLAVQRGIGWCPDVSADLFPAHPEKVLLCKRDFAHADPDLTRALITALHEACRWCDDPGNREDLISLLARDPHLKCDPEILRPALCGTFQMGHKRIRGNTDFLVFHRNDANRPGQEPAHWILNGMQDAGYLEDFTGSLNRLADEVFDPAFFDAAITLQPTNA